MRSLPILLGVVLIVFCAICIADAHNVEPREVSIEDLYEGKIDDGEYVKVANGISLYYVYVYVSKEDSEEYRSICHPIYSKDDPEYKQSKSIVKQHDPSKPLPVLVFQKSVSFKVLVETSEYDCDGDVPDGPRENEIIGTVSKTAAGLDSEMKKLMEEAYKDVDFDKTILIHQGDHPVTPLMVIGLFVGLVLIGVGIKLVISNRAKSRAAAYRQDQQPYGYNQQFPQKPYGNAQQPGINQPPQPPAQDSHRPPANDDGKFPPLRDDDDDFFTR